MGEVSFAAYVNNVRVSTSASDVILSFGLRPEIELGPVKRRGILRMSHSQAKALNVLLEGVLRSKDERSRAESFLSDDVLSRLGGPVEYIERDDEK